MTGHWTDVMPSDCRDELADRANVADARQVTRAEAMRIAADLPPETPLARTLTEALR